MARNEVAAQAIEWFSRTITILIVMVGPGLLGSWADKKFNTKWFAPLGILVGLTLATVVLILIAKKLTPPARGEPIAFEDDDPEKDLED